jgi:O-antigen ligase
MGVLMLVREPAALRPRGAVLATLAVLVLAAASSALFVRVQDEREEGQTARALASDPRLTLWPVVLDRVAQKPLTGYGFGRGIERGTLREEAGESQLWHAHNLFLDLMLQTGLPGVLFFAFLLLALAREGWRCAREAEPAAAALGMALLGVLAGMVIRNLTDTLLVRQNALLFWGVMGVLLAWGGRRLRGHAG